MRDSIPLVKLDSGVLSSEKREIDKSRSQCRVNHDSIVCAVLNVRTNKVGMTCLCPVLAWHLAKVRAEYMDTVAIMGFFCTVCAVVTAKIASTSCDMYLSSGAGVCS